LIANVDTRTVVIATLRRGFAGGNQSKNNDQKIALSALTTLLAALTRLLVRLPVLLATLMLVTWPPKDTKNGGHANFFHGASLSQLFGSLREPQRVRWGGRTGMTTRG